MEHFNICLTCGKETINKRRRLLNGSDDAKAVLMVVSRLYKEVCLEQEIGLRNKQLF